MRLDKFLAERGIGSRSEVKKIIRAGKVTVNGQTVTNPDSQITKEERVCFGNQELSNQTYVYYMFHKPAGCVTACEDAVQRTVMDYFKDCERVGALFPVGRLDKDTEGLLIITNDGDFSHRLTSPKKQIVKTYYFESEKPLSGDAVSKIKEGLALRDGMICKPARLELFDDCCGELSVSEGAYHQIKRMVAACGGRVTYLKRISIGALQLDPALEKGTYRELSEEEKCLATFQSVERI